MSEVDRKGGANAQQPAEKQADANGDNDPDFSLREAMRSHFLSSANRTHGAPSLADEELAEKLETHLKSTAAPSKEEAMQDSVAGLWDKSSPNADEEMLEPEPVVVEEPADVRDDDPSVRRSPSRQLS